MCRRGLVLSFSILSLLLAASVGQAQTADLERLRGFAEHQSESQQFERQRARGERGFLEEQEQWERQRDKDLVEFRKHRAEKLMDDNGPEAQEDQKEKKTWSKNYEEDRKEYSKHEQKFDRKMYPELVTEKQEFELTAERPRYAIKSRAMFGAPQKLGQKGPGSSGSMGGTKTSSANSGPSFPSPPNFNDFGGDNGFVPAPNMNDNFGDDVPPPPPPMPGPNVAYPDMNDFNGDIPPPPPPPMMNDDFGGF